MPLENFQHFHFKARKGEVGKHTLYIQRKTGMKTHWYDIALITLQWKKIQNISQNIVRIYKYKKAL